MFVKHCSGCSVRVFLDEVNIHISRLRKADCPLECGWPHSVS